MTEPSVSIILPCRGRGALLARAIASVQAQTFTDWELIVVDDASDPPLPRPGDPRTRLLRLPRNLGPAGAREAGLAEARGAWAAFLDSDDEWRPEKLARQMARLAAGPPRALVCGARVEGAGGPRLRPSRASRPGERAGAFLYLANEFAQVSGVVAPAWAARAAGFGG
ncbi:MAG: glycosyltransferase family 2 protein, partial [Pseudomonadota bacterium]